MARFVILVAGCQFFGVQALSGSGYDPSMPDEPFDTAAQAVSSWLTETVVVPRKKDQWQGRFCECVMNGDIASWFQMAPTHYIVDTCSKADGFVLRSGHVQDRHVEPLQSMMACDTLKVISYCLSHEAPEALSMWKPVCDEAHYTTPSCDVACNAAVRMAGGGFAGLAGLMAALVAGFAHLA
eukprot:TRINITY_DN474_c0_g1_i1.p1 TRINITY_DN474_c0_g1~~TRINITY_DN474_c0_g1_i1.p1  ORF type:complete len:207 (+),score=34.94 TRINITY_DN474_c0_g1_i1:77-622(+)